MIMFAVALLLSMVLCLLFGVPYIDFLRKKTIGQYILDVAPEAHAKKAGRSFWRKQCDVPSVSFRRLFMARKNTA